MWLKYSLHPDGYYCEITINITGVATSRYTIYMTVVILNQDLRDLHNIFLNLISILYPGTGSSLDVYALLYRFSTVRKPLALTLTPLPICYKVWCELN